VGLSAERKVDGDSDPKTRHPMSQEGKKRKKGSNS